MEKDRDRVSSISSSCQFSGAAAVPTIPDHHISQFFFYLVLRLKKGQKEQRIFSRPLALLDQKGQQLYLRRKEVEKERDTQSTL